MYWARLIFHLLKEVERVSRNLKEIWVLVWVKLKDLVTYWILYPAQTKLSNIFLSPQRYLYTFLFFLHLHLLQIVNNLCGKAYKELHEWLILHSLVLKKESGSLSPFRYNTNVTLFCLSFMIQRKYFNKTFHFPTGFWKIVTQILPSTLVVQGQDFCQGSCHVLIRNNLTKYWTSLIGCTDWNTVMSQKKFNLGWHWKKHKGKPRVRIQLTLY